MKRLAIALLSLGMLCTPHAWAGYDEGFTAYWDGNFATALKEWLPLAKQGDAQAQFKLGRMYYEGKGVRQDDAEAAKWFRKAAEQGHAGAQIDLGFMYHEGKGVRQDAAEAAKWFRKAAEQGKHVAQSMLGFMYTHGQGVRQDAAEAAKWTRKAAEQDYAAAQFELGVMYEKGKGVRQDAAEAEKWYRKAAEHDHAAAQLYLGLMYEAGEGVRQGLAGAVKRYRKAAKQGDAKAQLYLGLMYEAGEGVRQDAAEAVKWTRKAADQGDANAQYNLGVMYRKGEGVLQDYAEAVKWTRKAAEQGHARAQNKLGFMYTHGQGVRQDAAEAVNWYRKAAEQGHAEAQSELGGMYEAGKGVRQDATEAVKWYRKAAEQGYLHAQFHLGGMYKAGIGVHQDAAEAVKWYRMALANSGRDDWLKRRAQERLDALLAAAPQPQKPVFTDHESPSLSVDRGTTQTITQGDLLIQGSATDASGVAEVTVDGKAIEFATNGAFSLKRFFPLGATVLEISATDIHGNRAMQKLTVMRQAAAAPVAADEPELTPPPAKTRQNPNALALILGVEDYRNAPKARWAAQDAAVFYDYAQRSLGIPAGNIKLLTGEQANRTGMLSALKTWLAPMVTPGKSQVYVYFAGHGLASADGRATYLIPQDGDPNLLEDTALDRERLIDEIVRVKPQSMTLFLDTCYSGGARGGEGTLVEDTRGIMVKSRAASRFPGLMQFSAASNNQLAHSHPSQQHGLYSYYLMRGLGGEADANKDNKLTAGELQDYVQEKVKRMSMTQGRAQEPELVGDRDRVIAHWGR